MEASPGNAEDAAEESAQPLGDNDCRAQRVTVHGDEHEGGVASRNQDVDRAVIGDAKYAAYVWQHEKTGYSGMRRGGRGGGGGEGRKKGRNEQGAKRRGGGGKVKKWKMEIKEEKRRERERKREGERGRQRERRR